MKFHAGTEIIFTVSKTGILEKDRFLQAIKARKEIVLEGQKILFFPDLGTVINIKRKQWIPTSAGVSFVLNCSPPACWEYCTCLLCGKFQESYLYPLCEGLRARYVFPCAWLQYCANWNTGETKPQLGSPDQSPRTPSHCTVKALSCSCGQKMENHKCLSSQTFCFLELENIFSQPSPPCQ